MPNAVAVSSRRRESWTTVEIGERRNSFIQRRLSVISLPWKDKPSPKSEPDMPSTRTPRSEDDIKVVLLGKAYGGKTSLFHKFTSNTFVGGHMARYQTTIGVAYGTKILQVGEREIKIGIWDTGGCERFEAISRLYYRGAKAAIVCCDLGDIKSYERASFWINELKESEKKCKVYVAGTKKDLVDAYASVGRKRQVTTEMLEDLKNDDADSCFETSSRTGEGIDELFLKIAEDCLGDIEKAERKALGSDENQNQRKTIRLFNTDNEQSCMCSR